MLPHIDERLPQFPIDFDGKLPQIPIDRIRQCYPTLALPENRIAAGLPLCISEEGHAECSKNVFDDRCNNCCLYPATLRLAE